MDAAQAQIIQNLVTNLEELTTLYRQLLEVVRKERDLLIAADLRGLDENNSLKDSLIMKVRLADQLRLKRAEEAAAGVGADPRNPRLLEIARRLGGPEADRLRVLHGTLDTLLRRIADLNKDNEEYANSALKTLRGAMDEIKGTLSGKKTYERKGNYKLGPETTGNFVSKEA
ncbi:MAG TPA: flagellar protein FlgN [Pseudobdellovibrionaceae bacterium]|mgnify:CR=1 FL=1|nr:flagellar protein FlgN [Pseudobdellovibrionaceae bacterium]